MQHDIFTNRIVESMRLPIFEFTNFYQTHSQLFVHGYNGSTQKGKLLRVRRGDSSVLEVDCDNKEYTVQQCHAQLQAVHEKNSSHGGLQPICKAYGILGCFRFLAGYYFLVLTERQYIAHICGHGVYRIDNVQLIPLQQGHVKALPSKLHSAERRYRKLLMSGLDLSRDFMLSYSYSLCHSLQTNLTKPATNDFDSRFVWNGYLSQDLRKVVSSEWVVPMVHGYLEQKLLSMFGASVHITLIARRSRFFAGTRYLKRGINHRGHVANDVETEQIVHSEGKHEASKRPLLSSMVQVRGSIPLYWTQDPSPLNVKPHIQLQHFDPLYEATALHFEDLAERYGTPIVVLNLIKRKERVPRESLLGAEFKRALHLINLQRTHMEPVRYIAWDFNQVSKTMGFEHLLPQLEPYLNKSFQRTGCFVFNPFGAASAQDVTNRSSFFTPSAHPCSPAHSRRVSRSHTYAHSHLGDRTGSEAAPPLSHAAAPGDAFGQLGGGLAGLRNSSSQFRMHVADSVTSSVTRPPHVQLQSGLVRTNCIDCLDRTNVVQCIYGLHSLGAQLKALRISDSDTIDHNSSLATVLMGMYERMGNSIAFQYGGSEAHSQFFQSQRGNWEATMQSRNLLTSIRRFYSNTVTDTEKQHAMNLFLGNFVPQAGKPALWELESDFYLHQGLRSRDSPDPGPSLSPTHSLYRTSMRASDNGEAPKHLSRSTSATTIASGMSPLTPDILHPHHHHDAGGFGETAGYRGNLVTRALVRDLSQQSLRRESVASSPSARHAGLGSHARSVAANPAMSEHVTGAVDRLVAQTGLRRTRAAEATAASAEEVQESSWSFQRILGLLRTPWSVVPAETDNTQRETLQSFDDMMASPFGCPVSVRTQQDTAHRVHTQPLLGFFRSALGLRSSNSKQQLQPASAQEETRSIDGMSHDLQTQASQLWAHSGPFTEALSTGLDALATPNATNPATPVLASPQHPSRRMTGSLMPPVENDATQLPSMAAHDRCMPRTHRAGLPLFLKLPQMTQANPRLESWRSTAGSENIYRCASTTSTMNAQTPDASSSLLPPVVAENSATLPMPAALRTLETVGSASASHMRPFGEQHLEGRSSVAGMLSTLPGHTVNLTDASPQRASSAQDSLLQQMSFAWSHAPPYPPAPHSRRASRLTREASSSSGRAAGAADGGTVLLTTPVHAHRGAQADNSALMGHIAANIGDEDPSAGPALALKSLLRTESALTPAAAAAAAAAAADDAGDAERRGHASDDVEAKYSRWHAQAMDTDVVDAVLRSWMSDDVTLTDRSRSFDSSGGAGLGSAANCASAAMVGAALCNSVESGVGAYLRDIRDLQNEYALWQAQYSEAFLDPVHEAHLVSSIVAYERECLARHGLAYSHVL